METYPGGEPNLFNMAVMGLRLGQRANGVSLLHGNVSREMFSGLWPGFDPDEVPITSVTNGVHAPTWVAPEVFRLGARQIGAQRTEDAMTVGGSDRWDAVAEIPDQDIWELRRVLREQLVTEVRERLRASWRQRGAGTAELGWIDGVLDPDVLTIGFARRVPSYKRLTLMLRDRDRLMELLLHPERPIQIVVAGKAHPADDGGKRLVQELVRFADDPRVRHRIVFLPDYGMAMAQKLYPGCDIWLNNPLRPLEACGTSGMKAALNGCLNLSVLDGWWDEWFQPDFGWAIPTADGAGYGRRPPRRPRGRGALRPPGTAGDPPLLRARPGGPARPLDRDGPPDPDPAGPEGPGGAHGPRVRGAPLRPGRARPPRHAPDAARELADWKSRVRTAWPHVTVDHVETSAATPTAELGTTLGPCGSASAWATSAPDDVEVQAVSGRVDAEDRIADADGGPAEAGGRPGPGGPLGVRGPPVPGPHRALRLHGADPSRPPAAGVGRGTGAGGGAFGGAGGGGGGADAVKPPPPGPLDA